jgi:hypothetical protein
LLAISLIQSGVLVKQKLDDRKLDKSAYAEVSQQAPVCLLEKSSPSGYLLLEADDDAKVYRGVRILAIFQVPLEISMRDLNSRKDLVKVDCKTGQPE